MLFKIILALVIVCQSGVNTCLRVDSSSDSVCGCIRRDSFNDAYLQSHFPSLFDQYKQNYTFSIPEITYPNCTAIVANCTAPAQIASFTANTTIRVGGSLLPNPYKLTSIRCEDGHWVKDGLGSILDDNIRQNVVSCALKV